MSEVKRLDKDFQKLTQDNRRLKETYEVLNGGLTRLGKIWSEKDNLIFDKFNDFHEAQRNMDVHLASLEDILRDIRKLHGSGA